jgi:branched-chain amino acid transport system permease protein
MAADIHERRPGADVTSGAGGPRRIRPAWIPWAILLLAAVYPLAFGTGGTTQLLEQIFAFGAFAMSYDLLIGYTGILSFGHAMFFGTGAYAVAILLNRSGGSLGSLLAGLAAGVLASLVLSAVVAFLSLRVREAYFAMITLAAGQVLAVLAGSQALRGLTNANDGLTIPLPDALSGDLPVYYVCLGLLVLTTAFLTRLVHSPVGDVLRGIRENADRVRSLGHPVVRFQALAFAVSGVIASLAGGVFALAQSFVSTTVYDVAGVSLNVLLMVVIGGAGTLYGGLLGAALLLVAQTWFASAAGASQWFREYMLAFGVLYIVVVRFLPRGILGAYLHRRGHSRWRKPSDFKTFQT